MKHFYVGQINESTAIRVIIPESGRGRLCLKALNLFATLPEDAYAIAGALELQTEEVEL